MRPVDYVEMGWHVCALHPRSKRPRGQSWQIATRDPEWWDEHPDDGVGLVHGPSGTCALDVDDYEAAVPALARVGIDLPDLLARGVQIVSRPGRAKLLYRCPDTVELRTHQVRGPEGVIYELRAGVSQDVLPPSIHPDTGRPYEWVGDPTDLPMLPLAVLDHWRSLDRPREAVAGVRPRQYEGDGRIIDRFCAVADVGRVLESHGYVPHGVRWLSPHSTSGTPGVVLLPDSRDGRERVYCHHGSDPLADGYSHDAFSLFCLLDHGGDVTSAVRTAALEVGETEEDAELARSLDAILSARRHIATGALPEPEAHLGPIPVPELALLHDHVMRSVPSPKRSATLQGTLALACLLAGRRYATPEGCALGAWFGVVDTSVAGHRPLKAALEMIAHELGQVGAVRATPLTSAASVYGTLIDSARTMWVTPTLGGMIRKAPRQTSDAYQGALSAIAETWDGRQLLVDRDTGMTGRARRTDAERRVVRPQFVLLALLSIDEMGLLSTDAEYGRGTPQHLVCADAGDAVHGLIRRGPEDLPDEVRAAASRLRSVDDSPGSAPDAVRVAWTGDADAHLAEVRSSMRAALEADHLRPLRGCAIGYSETARRVACALACWRSPAEPVVDLEIATWAGLWSRRCLAESTSRLAVAPQDDRDDVASAIEYMLHDSRDGLTLREMTHRCRPLRRLRADARMAVLSQLIDDGRVEPVDRGRAKAYRCPIAPERLA